MAGDIVFEMVLDDRGMVAGVKRADIALKDFQRTAQRTAKVVKESEEKYESLGHKFRSMVITFGALRFALMDVHDVFLRLPLAILNTSGELEKMRVLMKGISNEVTELAREAEGTKDFNYVINFSKTAPFDIKSLSDSFVKLKTAGLDPATGAMDALVNSVAKFGGDGEVLKRASIAIQQMAGKGVISMEELRQQLGEAIPTAMRDMADGLGMTMAELAKAVKTGTLQAGPALQAMFIQMRINSLGAAAEFMETWSGATSQLKTEWALATELIANSGFAESSKDAVAELVKMLRSPEFREFGTSFGSGLANVVEVLQALISGVIKYREEIGYFIKGLVALKAIDILGSIGKSANELATSMNAARKKGLETLEQQVVGNRKANFEAHTALQKSLRDEQTALAEKERLKRNELVAEKKRIAETMAAKRLEFDQYQAINRQMVAEAAALQAKLDAVKGGVNLPGTQGFTSRANVQAQIDEKLAAGRAANNAANAAFLAESAAINRSNEVRRQMVKELDAHVIAQKATNDQIYKSVVQQKSYVAQSGLATIATKAMTGATTALSAAMSFMGGPIGLLITGLAALSFWWMKVKNDAEEAGIRQRNALRGIASEESLKKTREDLEDAEGTLATMKRDAANAGTGALFAGFYGNSKSIKEQEEKIKKLRVTLANSEIAVKITTAKDAAEVDAFLFSQEERAISASIQDKGRILQAAAKKEVQAAGDNQKLKDAAARKLAEGNRALLSENDTKLLEVAENFQRKAAAQLGAANIPAGLTAEGYNKLSQEQQNAIAIATAADERVEQLRQKLKATNSKTGADFGEGLGVPPKPPKTKVPAEYKPKSERDTAIEELTNRTKARAEAAQEFLNQSTSINAVIDRAAIEEAKIREKLDPDKDKSFVAKNPKNKKDVALLEQKKEEAKKQVERLVEEMRITVGLEEQAKLREKVANELKEYSADYKNAMNDLAVVGSNSKMGDNEAKFEKFLLSLQEGGKSTEVIKRQFDALKISVDEVRKSAKFADAVVEIKEMQEASKNLSESEIGLSRQVIKERKMARLEEYRQRIQDKIEIIKKEKGLEEQAAKNQKLLDDQIAATKKQINEDAKSPLEKMASDWENTTKQMEDATANWANSTMDSITELVTTGQTSFSNLANSILKDLARIAVNRAMGGAVNSAFDWIGNAASSFFFADGGIMTSMGSLPLEKYAMGGIANSPQVAVFGEGRMNEAYVPLPDGRTIPVTMTGGGGGNSNVVSISINVAQGSADTEQSAGSDANAWKEMASRVRGVVMDELVKQKRPGGALYS